MSLKEPAKIAAACRHYAMCKIDYLGTGICPSACDKPYVAYYPQGRMDIYDALAKKLIPVTEALVDIARSCNLCGICDMQCHFVTELRPVKVMQALKAHVEDHLVRKGKVVRVKEDAVLRGLRKIVGKEYATNDPAILVTYANDPFPLADMQMPRYVVLPQSTQEVAEIVTLANRRAVPYAVRGNGGRVFGFVFTNGIVVDTNRMKGMEIDPGNWTVTVEAGVTSYELQQEVSKRGFRVNVAEPAATHAGNIVCTGIFSTWSASYGTAADNFVSAEFVDREGNIFSTNDKSAPNIFAFRHNVISSPGICTKAVVRMHPVTDDEEGLLVPLSDFEEAVSLARTLSVRRLGLAIGVLGGHYLSTFISPSTRLADQTKAFLADVLGIKYAVFVIGDRFARSAIRTLAPAVIDQKTLTSLMLGLPRLLEHDICQLIQGLEGDRPPYELLCKEEVQPLLETVLSPSPAMLAGALDEDLRPWYEPCTHVRR
ncbi:MAG: iron-sulfur cluster-binding FAD-binding oxidoreductase [Deltaproteobacteria bacterium]|nr:iron-sulfur cluster-binding FAD-binding oxidoreductase [Deltaproteobacteria bacterium]